MVIGGTPSPRALSRIASSHPALLQRARGVLATTIFRTSALIDSILRDHFCDGSGAEFMLGQRWSVFGPRVQ